MSLYNTINRASDEALETQTKKALAKKVKDRASIINIKIKDKRCIDRLHN